MVRTLHASETRHSLLTERLLLTLAAAFMLVNFVALMLLRTTTLADWLHFAAWMGCATGGHWMLNRFIPRRDPLLFPLAMFFSGWGLVLIERLEPFFADRQTVWLVISTLALLAVTSMPQILRWLRSYRYLLLTVGLLLLIGTVLLGSNPSGLAGAPELWLGFGNVFFQPSELLKIILVVFLASYLGEQVPLLRNAFKGDETPDPFWSPRILGPIFLMWSLTVALVIWQRDLGTAALFFGVFIVLLYVASGRTWILLAGVGLLGIAGVVGYNLFSVVELRVDIWFNPWPEADGRAYQIVQSLMAFAAGGVGGNGIGQGSPGYIPVVHSDFIFAALAEEYGLLGVIVLVALFAVLVLRGLLLALRLQERPFYALLALGLSTVVGLQGILIMGGVLKLLPLTGVTLPFLSYGGSSLITSFLISGLLLRLSAEEAAWN